MSIKDITLQLILKFLKDKGYTESFLSLEIQSKANLREYPKQIEFLRKILMRGDFNEAVQFLWTFEQKIPNATLRKLTLEIYKQKLYELLENPEELELRNLFQKQIINVCSEDEYQYLFTLLTSRSVRQLPGMDSWSSMKGRYACFEQIEPYLESFFNMTHYQKNSRFTDFQLEEAIQSYITAEQRVEQRMDKSQANRPAAAKQFSTDKQSKQSIQMKMGGEPKVPRYDNKILEEKNQKPMEMSSMPKSKIQKNPYTNSIALNPTQNQGVEGAPMSKSQQQTRKQTQLIEMSESKIEKSQYANKYDRGHDIGQTYQSNQMEGSSFNKKYNPYIAGMNNASFNKSKDQMKHSKYPGHSLKLQDVEEEERHKGLSEKQIRGKEAQREKQRQIQRQKQKQKRPQFPPSYLKQFQKEPNDSDIFQEEVRRNIAYLDQNNNSIVYKDDENQNFTFSNGAQQSGLQERNRRILKLATISDPKAIRTCQFSPSSNLFALGTNSSYLKIYDIEQLIQTNQPKQLEPVCQIPQLHSKSIFCLDWSSNEKAIATCSNDLTIKLTQFSENYSFSNYKTNVVGRHQSCIRMVKFNSLENRIVSCGDDSLLKVWDIGKIKKCTNLKGHTQSISAFRFADNEQDNIIYSVSKDCTIRKWDLRIAETVAVSQVTESQMTFIANHIDRIVVCHKNGYVSFFNEALQLEHSVQIHEQEIRSIDGTNYDDLLLTASFDGHISIFTEKSSQSPNYHQHNDINEDKVVYATFMNHPERRGFASTSTLGLCNIYSYQ